MNGEGKIRFHTLKGYMRHSIYGIEGIEILDRSGYDSDYLFTVKVRVRYSNSGDSRDACDIRVGARDTWLEFNGIRYETLDDFDRLAVSLEREKIENMLEAM